MGLTEDDLFLMVNLRGRSTGLPMNLWLGPRGRSRHPPHIMVQMDHRAEFDIDRLAAVRIVDSSVIEGKLSAADLELVRRYIDLNQTSIFAHWLGLTDGAELVRALKRLPP